MPRAFTRALTMLLASVTAGVAVAAPAYYVSPTFIAPQSVSNEGTAAGNLGVGIGIWNPAQSIETSIGGMASAQPGISADGRYVGGTAPAPSDGKSEIARYDRTTSTWTTYGGAGGYTGSTRSLGWGISRDGSTVLGFGYGTPQSTATYTGIRPITAKDGVVTDYSLISNATSTNRIYASSTNGSVVSGITRPTTSTLGAFYWVNGVASPIYVTGTTFAGDPLAMSGDGTRIGGNGNLATADTSTPPVRRPYIYDTTAQSIQLLESIAGLNGNAIPGTATRIDGFLTGISEDGTSAVGFFRAASQFAFLDKVWGFLWTEGQGVQSLDQVVAGLGVDVSTQWLVPYAISPDGTTITGYQYQRGTPTTTGGFMITGIPEPTCLAGLAGLAILSRRRRRQ